MFVLTLLPSPAVYAGACLTCLCLVSRVHAGMPAGSSRTPEPGYVLLITCPAAACSTSRQPGSLSLLADFSSSMGPLCDALQAGIGPHWGSLPSLWRKAAAAGTAGSTKLTAFANGSGGHSRSAAGSSAGQPGRRLNTLPGCADMQHPGGKQPWQAPVMPAHGLHMSSHTRSLAGIQVGDMLPPASGSVYIKYLYLVEVAFQPPSSQRVIAAPDPSSVHGWVHLLMQGTRWENMQMRVTNLSKEGI